jgi:general secretion pathway protein K
MTAALPPSLAVSQEIVRSVPADARHRGSALLLVLFALFLLTAAVMAFALVVRADLERAGDYNRGVEAKAMAHSGLAIAFNPMVSQKTPGLEEQLNAQMGFRVRIVGEGGKLPINSLLQGLDVPNDPLAKAKRAILVRWLENHGLTFQEREHLIDCMLDWTDGDDLKHLNGIEDEGTYHPENRPFQSVEEVASVAGMEPLLASPGWRDELTVFTDKIDLSAADEATLRLLPGLPTMNIAFFLKQRRGPDGVDGTIDDTQFTTYAQIRGALGLNQPQMIELQKYTTLKDPTVRIVSEGHSANIVRHVEVIARKGSQNYPTILDWKE